MIRCKIAEEVNGMAKPIQGIEPLTGEAAEWLTRYLASFEPSPRKQQEVEDREREGAKHVVLVKR